MRGRRARLIGRLTKRPEFLAAAAGRRFHTDRMTLQGRLRDSAAEHDALLRFGFTVTKKVGHATERNRIKRRLRAAAREAGAGHADKPADVVVIGRRTVLSAAYGLLVEDIGRGLGVVTKPQSAGSKSAGPMSAGPKGAGSKILEPRGAAPKGAARRSSPLFTGDARREPPHA